MESKEITNPCELAWERLKADNRRRVFINLPFEEEIVESNKLEFLSNIQKLIESKNIQPKPAQICEVPKYGYTIRPASLLSIEDRLLYYYFLGECYSPIFEKLRYNGKIDYSYKLTGDTNKIEWIKNTYNSWNSFREESIKKLQKEKITHLLTTDISAFYDNIDIETLINDLKEIGCSEQIVNFLSRCLNRWCFSKNRGIPQGFSPSDILAKLYMFSVDTHLSNKEFIHLRYSDDIRIFCNSKNGAKRALKFLLDILRKRGLNVQTSKTKILKKNDAIKEINRIESKIEILKKCEEEPDDLTDDQYAEINEDKKIYNGKIPVEPLEKSYKEHIKPDLYIFEKTLFHFILKRLGAFKNELPYEDVFNILEERPEETEYILNYISNVGLIEKFITEIRCFLEKRPIYDYQIFKILEWLDKNTHKLDESLVSIIRDFYENKDTPFYLSSICRKLIGKYGNISDKETIEAEYSEKKTRSLKQKSFVP